MNFRFPPFLKAVGWVKRMLPLINILRQLPFPVVAFILTASLLMMAGMVAVDGIFPDALPDQFDLERIQRVLDAF